MHKQQILPQIQQKTSSSVSLTSSMWDSLGNCIDLFEVQKFPKFSVSVDSYPIRGIQYSINMNDASILTTILSSKDTLYFSFGGCKSRKYYTANSHSY